jgi:hypothetical protein
MAQPRKLQQYQRLNAFGEPFRGSKIGGVQARRYMGGGDQGPLSTRPRYNVREEAEAEAMRQERVDMEAAAARGMAAAGGGASQSQPTAPKRREGMLIPTAGGGSKWASGAELDRMNTMKAKARKQARRTMDMSAKNAAGVAAFGTGQPPAPMSAAEAAKADRAKARARYEAEKASEAKPPQPRQEPAMQPSPAPSKAPGSMITDDDRAWAKAKKANAQAVADKATKQVPVAKTAEPKPASSGFSSEFYRRFAPIKSNIKLPEPEKPKPKPKPTPGKVQVARAINKAVKGAQYAATMPLRNAAESAMAPVRVGKAASEFVSNKINAARRWWETGE